MGMGVSNRIWVGLTLGVCAVVWLGAQEPPAGRGAGAGRGGAAPPAGQTPAVPQVARSPVVDQAAHDRGRALWASHCIDCHGSQARGSDTGPNIIRTRTVNFDRSAAEAGSVLGPFLKAGHPTQSQKPSASFTDAEVVDLANFLRQKVNDTMRGSALFTAGDVLVGNAKAGEAYFNGAGGCATCHNATTRSLAGVATRIPEPVDLQQRMLFPGGGGRGRGRGPGAPRRRAACRRRRSSRARAARAGGDDDDDHARIRAVDHRRADRGERLLHHPAGHGRDGARGAPQARPQDHDQQSAAGAHRPARSSQRHADPRSGRLPGDDEMRALISLGAILLLTAAVAGDQGPAARPAAGAGACPA